MVTKPDYEERVGRLFAKVEAQLREVYENYLEPDPVRGVFYRDHALSLIKQASGYARLALAHKQRDLVEEAARIEKGDAVDQALDQLYEPKEEATNG